MEDSNIDKLTQLVAMTPFVESITREMMTNNPTFSDARYVNGNYSKLMNDLLKIEILREVSLQLEEDLNDPEFVEALKYVQEHGTQSVFLEPINTFKCVEIKQVIARAIRTESHQAFIVDTNLPESTK